LCGCEGIAGIEDIALGGDAEGSDGNGNAQAEGGPEAGADAPTPDALTGSPDGKAIDAEGGAMDDGSDGAPAPTTDATVDGPPDAAPDVSIDQTVDVAAETDDGGGASQDSAIPDAIAPSDAQSDSSSQGDATDANVPSDAGADGPVTDAGGLVLVLIDDQLGTNGVGWLDGKGLKGTWYSYADSTSSIAPDVADAGPASIIGTLARDGGVSPNAVHVTGKVGASTSSNAGMGFNLNNGSPYVASAYTGFVFWGRTGGDAGTTTVRFQVTSTNTASLPFTYGENLTFSPNWTQFVVHYSDLTPPVWYLGDAGTPTFTDSAALIACQFQLGENIAFDVWVDDVYFLVGP
jgi:hypothetical protein